MRIRMLKHQQIVVVTGIDNDGGLLKHMVELPAGSEYEVEPLDTLDTHEHGSVELDAAHCAPVEDVDLQFDDGSIWHNAIVAWFEVIP